MSTIDLYADTSAASPVPDGPKPLPVLGNLLQMGPDRLSYFVRLSQDYGSITRYYIGPSPILMLNRAEHVKRVLQDNQQNYRKSRYYEKVRPILGEGIFLSEGKVWLEQRRTLSPAFRRSAMTQITEGIIDATDDLLDDWRARADTGEPIDVAQSMLALTLDVVFRSLLNVPLGREAAVVSDHLANVLREAERRVWSLVPLSEHLPTKRKRTFKRSLAYLHDLVDDVIAQRRGDPDKHEDLLSHLFAARRDPTLEAMRGERFRDQIMSVILAAQEATANALSWTWYLLSTHPEIGLKVYAEARRVLGDRRPEFGDIQRLGYTRQVFDEVLRLYPPLWTLSRDALGPDRLGQVEIAEGDTLMLCPYAIHRNPLYWENPEAFDPDRFAPEQAERRPLYAYFPFSGGPRNCIGKRFGIIEGQLVIAMIARAMRLDLVSGRRIEPEPMITLRPRGAVPMTLHGR